MQSPSGRRGKGIARPRPTVNLRLSDEALDDGERASELRLPQLAHDYLVCGYAIKSRCGGEAARISQTGKGPVLVDSENAD